MNTLQRTGDAWPRLPLGEWPDTYATVHLWTQMLGKTRLALSPVQNHWWHAALYLTPRGLATAALPCGARRLDVELDFVSDASDERVARSAECAHVLTIGCEHIDHTIKAKQAKLQ